jgi:hypothetical protein
VSSSTGVSLDAHEWFSFEDPDEERTWLFDVTFLASRWTCIYGRGCQGVLTEPAAELQQGCCSYGAHLVDDEDRARVEACVERLDPQHWQYASVARRRGGPVKRTSAGEVVTRIVDGACIFLNRPGFAGGAGCALHQAALAVGERPLDWKPDVCWQLPLRRTDETDDHGHVVTTVREWKRRDWGDGGAEFAWWCTEAPEAFTGGEPVYRALRDELVELIGDLPYRVLAEQLDARVDSSASGEVLLPHPALRRRA